MPDAYVFDAVRSPRGRGKKSGSLYTTRPIDLLAQSLRALGERNELDTSLVDDVVIGCVTQTGDQGACIARFAALEAGWDVDAPGVTLNRFCGSGLQAVNDAAAMVVTNAAGAKRAPRPPAWVIAHAKRTEFAVFPGRDPIKPAAGVECAKALFKKAGITNPRRQIDCAELYVPFSWFEPMWLEGHLICEEGEGWKMVD